jgi:hypothetical protein
MLKAWNDGEYINVTNKVLNPVGEARNVPYNLLPSQNTNLRCLGENQYNSQSQYVTGYVDFK